MDPDPGGPKTSGSPTFGAGAEILKFSCNNEFLLNAMPTRFIYFIINFMLDDIHLIFHLLGIFF
jgi:hypothetical protein